MDPVYVRLRQGIDCLDRTLGAREAAVLHDTLTGKFFHLGHYEKRAVAEMDGTKSVDEIAASLQQAGIPWSVEDVQAWAMHLVKSDLAVVVNRQGNELALPAPDVGAPVQPGGAAKPLLTQLAIALSHVVSQRIPLWNADRAAKIGCSRLGVLFSSGGTLAAAGLTLVAVCMAVHNSKALADDLRSMFSPASWPLMVAIWFVLKIVHESGHAIAAKRNGVRVGDAGIMLFLFAPMAYVDVTDAWRLRNRWSRVQIALGGVYFEAWTAIFAVFAFALMPDGLARHAAAQWIMIAGPASWLVNANPLLRLDGYYALSDALNIPNLRMHGRAHWQAAAERVLLGIPAPPKLLVGWRSGFATSHAAASILFQILWMSGLIFAVSQWAGLVGLVLAICAALLWGLIPLAAWNVRHWQQAGEQSEFGRSYRARLIGVNAIAITVIVVLLNINNPIVRGVPVMVQYREEQIGRAAANGFVTQVRVQSGQPVSRGELLIEVRDDDLSLRREQLNDDLLLALSKHRQMLRKGEFAAAEAQQEKIRGIKTTLEELDQSLAELRITAGRDGIVVSARPEQLLGRFVRRGDILIRVADPADKELLIAFPEAQWSGYFQAIQSDHALTARLRGGHYLRVHPQPAQPRFRDSLPHPAMAGSNGGDIAVIADAEAPGGLRSLQPLGEAVAHLSANDSRAIRSGQRGRLYLSDTRSIVGRLWDYLSGS